MKGHRRGAAVLGDSAGVDMGEVVVVDSHPELHRHRHALSGGVDHGADDPLEQGSAERQRRTPAVTGDLGDRAAEVQVDVVDVLALDEDLHGLGEIGGIGAVQLQ